MTGSASRLLAPMTPGRADGWGLDDSLVVAVVMVALLLTVTAAAAIVPRHGGRVAQWKICGRAPQGLALIAAGAVSP